jgi:uncharacterized protein YcaQ
MAYSLSVDQARRIALAAQGFGTSRRDNGTRIDRRHFAALFRRLGLIQIDSVNVLVRAHYMPAYSRLGPYPMRLVDAALRPGAPGQLFEYWGHEACLLPVELHPFLRWRMERARDGKDIYKGLARFARERRDFIDTVFQVVRDEGPLSAGELEQRLGGKSDRKGSWWGWSKYKGALEWLFWGGLVSTAARRNFERVYDLPERVIPSEILNRPTPLEAEAQRELIRVAVRALGVGTEADLRDYFRLNPQDSQRGVRELAEASELVEVQIEGWRQPAYAAPPLQIPRRKAVAALVSPFDPLVWERRRTERLFDFHYRIEIYTPAPKRQFGYYVLPFLLGPQFVARVDLKAEREAGILLVHAAHAESGVDHEQVGQALMGELRLMARWLGLGGVEVRSRGNLVPALRGL